MHTTTNTLIFVTVKFTASAATSIGATCKGNTLILLLILALPLLLLILRLVIQDTILRIFFWRRGERSPVSRLYVGCKKSVTAIS